MKIAVLGYGTVGSGVVEVLEKNQEIISERAGKSIEVKYVLDLRDFPGQKIQEKIVHDYNVILNDEEIEIVVEVMGGVEPAWDYIKTALENGKHIVTGDIRELSARLYREIEDKTIDNVLSLCEELLEEHSWGLGVIAFDWAYRVNAQYTEDTYDIFYEACIFVTLLSFLFYLLEEK